MKKFVSPRQDGPLIATIRQRIDEVGGCKVALMYQLGEVYPFLRTHDLLNNLQSVVTDIPLVIFFPGEYVSSDTQGFYLSLFNKFPGDYYRAFQLHDYIRRGQISVDTE